MLKILSWTDVTVEATAAGILDVVEVAAVVEDDSTGFASFVESDIVGFALRI